MKEFIQKIADKLLCKHTWDVIKTTSYLNCDKHLMVCTKCGKTKKITL